MTLQQCDAPLTDRSDRTPSTSWALLVLSATQLMVILDGTIVNVALPTIRTDLGFSDTGLSWVVNAFFVVFAVLLLPAGRLGDLVGRRRVFLAGLALFTVASVACGLATGPTWLLTARAVQGAGGALTSAVVLGMIAGLYVEDAARARAFALLAFVGAAGASIGVVAGGVLTDLVSWRWVFWVNVPLGAVVLVVGALVLARDSAPGLGAGLAASKALVPSTLLRSRAFLLPNVVLFTMTTAGFSFQFLTALYLQDTLRLDALHTGLAYLPVTLAIAVTSLGLSGRLASRFGPARVLVVGLLLFVVGMLMMAALPDHGAYAVHVAPGFVVMGAGFGLAMPQVTALAMAAAPGDHAGAASGFVGTTQQVGGAVGLAVVALVAVHLGRAGGFLVAAAALAVGTAVAGYLATGTATRATSSRANVR